MGGRILLVDDEPHVLQGYARVLRHRFDLLLADGGEPALRHLEGDAHIAVLVSDMRMPGMDGLELLQRARTQAPQILRIMLTGNADQQTAIDAVNQGAIFRFLTKPCSPEVLAAALDQALRQHALETAERTLLSQTLKGALQMLVELLSHLDPVSFGRAQAMTSLAEDVGAELGMEDTWVLGIAAVLSQVGMLTLPESVSRKLQTGAFLTSHEREVAHQLPQVGAELIGHIPRLEEVAEVVRYIGKNFNGTGYPLDDRRGSDIPLGARVLRVVWDLERMRGRSSDELAVAREMEMRTTWYDLEVVRALGRCLRRQQEEVRRATVRRVALHELRIGQVLLAGVETVDGLLVIPTGVELTRAHLQRLRNFARLSGIREPIPVREP